MELFYRTYGQGRPLVIMHGLFGLSDNWVSFARMLSERYTILLPDLRNHGQSPHSSVMNYPAMAEDLAEFIHEHHLQNPIIMGHSMGGKVAMQFVQEYTNIPHSLVVVDISPRAYPLRETHLDIANAMLSIDFDHIKTRNEVEDQISQHIHDQKLQLFILKNLYRTQIGRYGWRPNLNAILDNLDYLTGEVILTRSFPEPALFIKGGKSDYLIPEDEERIARFFSKSKIVTIENAGHWVHADTPITLHEVLLEFLLTRIS